VELGAVGAAADRPGFEWVARGDVVLRGEVSRDRLGSGGVAVGSGRVGSGWRRWPWGAVASGRLGPGRVSVGGDAGGCGAGLVARGRGPGNSGGRPPLRLRLLKRAGWAGRWNGTGRDGTRRGPVARAIGGVDVVGGERERSRRCGRGERRRSPPPRTRLPGSTV
jgi:hypothetical protein